MLKGFLLICVLAQFALVGVGVLVGKSDTTFRKGCHVHKVYHIPMYGAVLGCKLNEFLTKDI